MATRHDRRAPAGIKGSSRAGRTLLLSINDYGNPQDNLAGCLAEAALFHAMLPSLYGFAAERATARGGTHAFGNSGEAAVQPELQLKAHP